MAGERDRVNVERPCRTVALESPDELGRSIGNGFFSMGFFVCEKVRPRNAAGNSSPSVSSSELLRDAELEARSERVKCEWDGRAWMSLPGSWCSSRRQRRMGDEADLRWPS